MLQQKAVKPQLSFWQIWNMSFGFLGIQFGFALQNANVSRIFETLGANIDDIPILWIAAPVTGLVVQPIVGYLSDRTWGKLGRRRPYFLVGAILASLALVVMPHSPVLWIAAGMLWIMDASINISMEPFRALVADLLPSEQRTMGFAVQSFFIGIGAVIASMLPYMLTNWFGVSNESVGGSIPDSVTYSFYIGAFAFLSAVSYTVFSTKEYPPSEAQLESMQEKSSMVESFTAGAKEIFSSLVEMPKTMLQLAVVQFFSWFALFAMWIYSTPAIAHHIFMADTPNSPSYQEAGNWVGVIFAVYNGVSAVAAFLLPALAKYIGRKGVHAVCLIAGGVGLASIYFVKEPNMLLFSMIGVGIAWSSILAMPYAILAGALPEQRMGVYMGIFNFFIVIPQIVAAAILGFIVKNFFANDAIYALLVGGVSMIVAAALVMMVHDPDDKRAISR